MSSDKIPVTIKKYANRRLYNTGTSAYVTLEDLAAMVKRGEDFVVYDAKSGDEITRSVLAQIIFEQEGKSGQSLLPISFLRQLIRFYGDSMQMLVPSFLEFSLDKFAKEKGGFGDVFASGAFPNGAFTSAARPMFAQIEEQTRQNMAVFRQALTMFAPFTGTAAAASTPYPQQPQPASAPKTQSAEATAAQSHGEFEEMRRQLEEMQRRLEGLAPKA